jgi:hypothetical protein
MENTLRSIYDTSVQNDVIIKYIEDNIIALEKNKRELFASCLSSNRLECAEYLYSLGDIKARTRDETIIKVVSSQGYNNILVWIFDRSKDELDNVGISIRESHPDYYNRGGFTVRMINKAFRRACKNGHKETAEFLYNLGCIDLEEKGGRVFIICKNRMDTYRDTSHKQFKTFSTIYEWLTDLNNTIELEKIK